MSDLLSGSVFNRRIEITRLKVGSRPPQRRLLIFLDFPTSSREPEIAHRILYRIGTVRMVEPCERLQEDYRRYPHLHGRRHHCTLHPSHRTIESANENA